MTKARENSDYTGLAADIVAGDTAARAGRKNLILNGSMQISQRGDYTSATSVADNQYTVDRIKVAVSVVTSSITHIIGGYASGSNSLKITATSTATGYCGLRQRLEYPEFLKGKVVTLSAKMKSNKANARTYVYMDGRHGSVTHSGSGNWETVSSTFTVPTTGGTLDVWASFYDNGSVSVTSGDYIEVAEWQLELGSVATDFEHRSYGEELQLCQRYYQDSGLIKYYMSGRWAASSGGSIGWWKWAVPMRAAPIVTTSGTWSTGNTYGGTPNFSNITTVGATIASTGITFPANTVMWFNNANILADAEL